MAIKLVAGIMTWNGEEYLEYCLEGLVGGTDGVLVIEGAVQSTIRAGLKARSEDKTLDILSRWACGCVEVALANKATIQAQWQHTLNEVRKRFGPCWMLAVDDDEIFTSEILQKLRLWIESKPSLLGGKIPNFSFNNDFQHYFNGMSTVFIKADKVVGFRACGPREFCTSPGLSTQRVHLPQIQRAPVTIFHYSRVRSAEHWKRWRLWCPHPRAVASRSIRGARVYEKTRSIEAYSGKHPAQMYKHPYMLNPPSLMENSGDS